MFKKIFYTIMITILLMTNMCIVYSYDADEDLTSEELINVINQASEEPVINSRIAVVYDRKSGTVIWGKDENKRTAMASTTKIMTAIVTIEKCDLSQVVTVSPKAAGTGGSRLGLKKEDKITINDLLYGLMLESRK